MSPPPLEQILENRRWLHSRDPFPHFYGTNVFTQATYNDLEIAFQKLLSKKLSEVYDPHRFSRNSRGYDAYQLALHPELVGPFQIFLSRQWHDMLAHLAQVDATGDVDAAFHHHRPGSACGQIHNDLNPAWYSKRQNGDIELAGSQCNYQTGESLDPGTAIQEVVRGVATIFYVNNPPWRRGDGGETGLYRTRNDPISKPAFAIPPINNSLLVFECTPYSFHTFLTNHHSARNSVVLWLHRKKSEVISRWGEGKIVGWSKK